jgi:hypothetical protein
VALGILNWQGTMVNGSIIMSAGLSIILMAYDNLSHIHYRFVDRDMMMRYHHFLGIGHVYSEQFIHETTGMNFEVQHEENEMGEMGGLTSDAHSREENGCSDSDSINTVDGGWQCWDDGEEDDDDTDGHESDGEIVEMDDMYGYK